MSEIYFPDQHTAEEWRGMAKRKVEAVEDSWERSDTDGFLSQWAGSQMSSMYHELAKVAENGGRAEIPWLFDAEGNLIEDWGWVKTRYGGSIRVGRGDDVKWFNPSHAKKGADRLARDRAKGFTMGLVETEVVLHFVGEVTLGVGYLRKNGAELKVISAVGPRYEDD